MVDSKVSKDKHISRWVDQENLTYLDGIESKIVYNNKEGDWWRKKE